MRIALTADPELPVPPVHYGGIERIVDMLARGLVRRGHDVTVFANPQSATAGKLVSWRGSNSRSVLDTLSNAVTLTKSTLFQRYDLIHSFSRIAYMAPILPVPIPKLMTYQRAISLRSVKLAHSLSRGTLWFSAISQAMMRGVSNVGTWRLVFNGIPLEQYNYREKCDHNAPLVFLGRVEEIKGPHIAISVASKLGIPLILAGNIPTEHQGWFEKHIAPHVDGRRVTYIGPVTDQQKNQLLGNSRALLMPILWEEPFGIVMAEAMACGTPVIGFARGAVPEVIEHGVTGFVSSDVDGLVAQVRRIGEIDRAACRERVERLFSDTAVVDAYCAIYTEMVTRGPGRAAA
jgi:glycosyltransferase involved in cell wall biosynthesis